MDQERRHGTWLLRQLRPQHVWTCCLSGRLGALILLRERAWPLHPPE